MSTELAPYQAPWVELLTPAAELARLVGKTEFVPANLRDRNGAIAACVLYGAELGLGPMQSLAKVAVIEGRPAPSAELARGLALGAGHDVWVEASSITSATVAGKRHNSEHVQRVTWTMDDARRAGLDGKPNWRRYPRQMLVARATAELVRNLAPDVLGGITLMAEELEGLDAEPPAELAPAPTKSRDSRKRSLAAVPAPEQPPQGAVSDETGAGGMGTAEDDQGVSGEATAAQKRMMHALFRELEVEGRAARLALTSDVIGRRVASSSELTAAEASILLDDLQRRKSEGWVAF